MSHWESSFSHNLSCTWHFVAYVTLSNLILEFILNIFFWRSCCPSNWLYHQIIVMWFQITKPGRMTDHSQKLQPKVTHYKLGNIIVDSIFLIYIVGLANTETYPSGPVDEVIQSCYNKFCCIVNPTLFYHRCCRTFLPRSGQTRFQN